jgi:hypothetical protein
MESSQGLGIVTSPKDYFREMVSEGFSRRGIQTYPAVKDYLVGVLEHYLDARNLFDEDTDKPGQSKHPTLAEMFMRAQQSDQFEKFELLKKLGDRSLYISGFFGDSLQRKLVDLDYYANMGGAAYGVLAGSVREHRHSIVFQVFSQRFVDFVDVLSFISQKALVQRDDDVLRLYERYLRTGSDLAKERLVEMGVLNFTSAKAAKQD